MKSIQTLFTVPQQDSSNIIIPSISPKAKSPSEFHTLKSVTFLSIPTPLLPSLLFGICSLLPNLPSYHSYSNPVPGFLDTALQSHYSAEFLPKDCVAISPPLHVNPPTPSEISFRRNRHNNKHRSKLTSRRRRKGRS